MPLGSLSPLFNPICLKAIILICNGVCKGYQNCWPKSKGLNKRDFNLPHRLWRCKGFLKLISNQSKRELKKKLKPTNVNRISGCLRRSAGSGKGSTSLLKSLEFTPRPRCLRKKLRRHFIARNQEKDHS